MAGKNSLGNQYVLGLSAYYHDSAAALICDGKIVAAAQEERFSRKKFDHRFPKNSIQYCLDEAGIDWGRVSTVVFYDKPLLKFERLLETYFEFAPFGLKSFLKSMPLWLREKLILRSTLLKELKKFRRSKRDPMPKLLFSEHHLSHAASAFFASPFREAAVLCLDGVGEWATTTAWQGSKNKIEPLWEINFPHSLGLLYSAFTAYCGFRVNSGEYKLMGLAPYGQPRYVNLIKQQIIDIKEDGSFHLNLDHFDFPVGLQMTSKSFHQLFGREPRKAEGPLDEFHMDIARSIQDVTEEVVIKLVKTLKQETNCNNLTLAGGVALNCVANSKILASGLFEKIWIQPAAGDSGGAIGAALAAWHMHHGNLREVTETDLMNGSFLGPTVENDQCKNFFTKVAAVATELEMKSLVKWTSQLIGQGAIVGWVQGRMEFGPRALGNRSILGDPRSVRMQSDMNLKIKFRESFRPFAPAVLEEDCQKYFEIGCDSPYMLFVAPVKNAIRLKLPENYNQMPALEKLRVPRSLLPAITHLDYSARIQTVSQRTNAPFHLLLEQFKADFGCSVLVNTSFNVRGEPIVCTVEDAYRCFMNTEIDALVVNNYLLLKKDQPVWADIQSAQQFELD